MEANNKKQQDEREKLVINIEADPFNGIATTKYITSNDFVKLAHSIFKSVFADIDGGMFDIVNNVPTVSMVFNHGVYDKEDTVAITRESVVDNNASTIQRIRTRDRLLTNGDRYFITDAGKDVFEGLLTYQAYNNGKPNWGKIVTEFSERGTQRFYGGYNQPPQFTKVTMLDLNKIAALIWGSDKDGDHVEYDVHIVRPINSGVPGMMPSNYMLSVTQVSSKELEATYEKLGFGSFSSIIR